MRSAEGEEGSSWGDFDRLQTEVFDTEVTQYFVTWLIVLPQYEDIHSPWPPRPVRWPRLAHVLKAQERNGEQLQLYRYVDSNQLYFMWLPIFICQNNKS